MMMVKKKKKKFNFIGKSKVALSASSLKSNKGVTLTLVIGRV